MSSVHRIHLYANVPFKISTTTRYYIRMRYTQYIFACIILSITHKAENSKNGKEKMLERKEYEQAVCIIGTLSTSYTKIVYIMIQEKWEKRKKKCREQVFFLCFIKNISISLRHHILALCVCFVLVFFLLFFLINFCVNVRKSRDVCRRIIRQNNSLSLSYILLFLCSVECAKGLLLSLQIVSFPLSITCLSVDLFLEFTVNLFLTS